ncbi:MAG: hypothetical protein CMJ78_14800 [Planctomycetaceae bacterium]|nr:hypothetical protein [Planctomycetaceae bacterium]
MLIKQLSLVFALAIATPLQLLAETASTARQLPAIGDAALKADGSITCRVLDNQGRVVAGEIVRVTQGRKLIAAVKTDSKGRFELKGMRGGLYRLQSGRSQALFRFWTAKAAPPSATSQAVLIQRVSYTQTASRQVQQPVSQPITQPSQPIVRGQVGDVPNLGISGLVDGTSLITLGAAVSAAAVSAVTLSEINDVEDKVDRIPTSP